jgi:RNA polymerase sigma factor (sigma-70 family)
LTDPPAALTAFCREEWPRLVGALALTTADGELARELAQETLARVSRDWEKVVRMDAPGAWAHRVAMNLANSHFRRRAAERRALNRLTRQTERVVVDHVDGADVLAVRAALDALTERQRAVLVARYYLDWSVRDTSQALGFPEGTVKTLTRQALQALRDAGLVDEPSEMEESRDGP